MLVSSSKQTRTRLGILFSLPLLFCIVFFGFQVFTGTTSTRLLAIQGFENDVNTLKSVAKDAESSERGFLLTGDQTLLSPVKQARITLDKMKLTLESEEKDFPQVHAQLIHLHALVERRLTEGRPGSGNTKGQRFRGRHWGD